eukprot:9271740-Pyramimonas_sp.AAC.1
MRRIFITGAATAAGACGHKLWGTPTPRGLDDVPEAPDTLAAQLRRWAWKYSSAGEVRIAVGPGVATTACTPRRGMEGAIRLKAAE